MIGIVVRDPRDELAVPIPAVELSLQIGLASAPGHALCHRKAALQDPGRERKRERERQRRDECGDKKADHKESRPIATRKVRSLQPSGGILDPRQPRFPVAGVDSLCCLF